MSPIISSFFRFSLHLIRNFLIKKLIQVLVLLWIILLLIISNSFTNQEIHIMCFLPYQNHFRDMIFVFALEHLKLFLSILGKNDNIYYIKLDAEKQVYEVRILSPQKIALWLFGSINHCHNAVMI